MSHGRSEEADAGSAARGRGGLKLPGALPVIVIAGLLLRVWAAVRAPIIESDGAYYAGLAGALLRGDLAAGLSPAWPPLLPFLTAAAAGLAAALGWLPTPEVLETSARLVSVLAGSLLLVPLHRLALRVTGRRGALLAVAFAAFHPRLIQFSGAALTEMPFAACLVAGVSALAAGRNAVAGAALGLAYLARPEGAPLALVLWLAAVAAGARSGPGAATAVRSASSWRARLRPAFPVMFAVVAAPYVAFVSLELGHASFGEKGAYNFWREHRREYGRVYAEPAGLSERMADAPALARAIAPPRVRVLEFAARAPGAVLARSARNLGVIIVSSYPVAVYPLLALLALLGLTRLTAAPWWPVIVPVAAVPLLYAPFTVDRRFFVPVIPLVALLAARGFEALEANLGSRLRAPGDARRMANAVLALLMVAALAYLGLRARPLDDAPEHRAAGYWLARHWPPAPAGNAGSGALAQPGPAPARLLRGEWPRAAEPRPEPVVMSRKPWVAFYAGGLVAELPAGDVEDVLARARTRRADVLVVDARWAVPQRPALAPLLDPAQAPPGLECIYRAGGRNPVVLYDVRGLRSR